MRVHVPDLDVGFVATQVAVLQPLGGVRSHGAPTVLTVDDTGADGSANVPWPSTSSLI